MKAKELLGKEVLDASGRTIGKVSDFEVDITKGVVENINVKAGFSKGYLVGLDKIRAVGDRIILTVRENEL